MTEAELSRIATQLNPTEQFLLKWLANAEGTRHAEVSGRALDDLINKRLAEVTENAHRPRQSWPTRCTLLGLLVAEHLPTRQ